MLAPGTKVGTYEIVGSLGAGGMGEVYRARDARLHRDVAIKVLPPAFAGDPDRVGRFEREAQSLAALNHPNIAQVFGVIELPGAGAGGVALVMELVEGEDLARRLAREALPVDEALPIARQIAEAIEAAHERGIIHRDLKPANIKLREDGTVKVLDFGLAKAVDPVHAATSAALEHSPTFTSPALTQMGVLLGTAGYMAPEQARGRAVDRRADIWAFGVILVEMLTGRRLFQGETVSDVMVSVLSAPIDVGSLPAGVPGRVREVIARCLERDPKRRLRDIGEARVALESLSQGVTESGVLGAEAARATGPVVAARSRWWLVPWAIAAAGVVAAAVFAILWIGAVTGPATAERLQLDIGAPWGEELVVQSNAAAAVISPDGSMVAFLAQGPQGRRLYVRWLATGEARAISGSEEAHYPFWSPDSRSLAFFGGTRLLTVSVAGGLPEAIAEINQGRGGTWTDTGVILFTPRGGGVIHRVDARGGDVQAVTALDASRGENAHYWPVALPGGRLFLFFVRSTRPENNGIYLGSLDGTTAPVRLVTALSSGIYAPAAGGRSGHLLWVRDAELLAQPLDVAAGRLTGEVTTVASDVRVEESQRGLFASVSDTGTLVWASAKAADLELRWFARDGRRLETLPIAPGKVMQPRISPDGRKLAFTRAANGTADIWLLEMASGTLTQLTSDPGYDENPGWSPDGRALVYEGSVGGQSGVVITTPDGSRPPRVLVSGDPSLEAVFMPKRPSLVMSSVGPKGAADLVMKSLDASSSSEPLTDDPAYERQPAPSPDERWLALVTDRRGRSEVVLARLFDDGTRMRLSDQRIPVSSGGGIDPRWRADGKEILYLASDRTIMAVSVTVTGDAVSLGKPTPLFRVPADAGGWGANWTSNADHTRFVVVDAPHGTQQTFRVLTNWRR